MTKEENNIIRTLTKDQIYDLYRSNKSLNKFYDYIPITFVLDVGFLVATAIPSVLEFYKLKWSPKHYETKTVDKYLIIDSFSAVFNNFDLLIMMELDFLGACNLVEIVFNDHKNPFKKLTYTDKQMKEIGITEIQKLMISDIDDIVYSVEYGDLCKDVT